MAYRPLTLAQIKATQSAKWLRDQIAYCRESGMGQAAAERNAKALQAEYAKRFSLHV